MTGAETKIFTENLLDGETMDSTFFYQLLDIAKAKIEAERPWRMLITEDSSNSVAKSNTFTTSHTLPSDFATAKSVFLIDSSNNPIGLAQVPFEMKYVHKDSSRKYYIDLANDAIYLTGAIGRAYTLIIFYAKHSAVIISTTSWVFPSRFHSILGFMVSVMNKAGVDYDEVNWQQAIQNDRDAKLIWDAMIEWDSKLQHNAIEGQHSDHFHSMDGDGIPEGNSMDMPLGLM